ncbi:multifunctional CCA protein [Formosimonas limnophila]|uniref:Multifunctional CCA protein n=2 Tax=Formosimonas limnophila TaxID=1384487 RepID=A0A8J3CJD3_9BURK|nr:multifunctional CCA protein [Formosimonas limnophila]
MSMKPEPQIYCVGGAIRDELMGLPSNDLDYVVVGATPDEMLRQGYTAVGQDFPVFLHPQTHAEYALARTERKTSKGYTGFAVHFDVDVTLEEDLARRDLTINAMARGVLSDGSLSADLVDPYHGQDDLEHKVLRHVSPAFVEDPVRILRLARFAARWPDFTVAPETMGLMQDMVKNGETDALVAERTWQEISRGLMEDTPSRMFVVLRECGLLKQWLPEVDALFGVPQRADYHPEIDTGLHVMMVIDKAAQMKLSLEARYGALCHDLGKGNTPAEVLPRHTGHESRGLPLIDSLSKRIKATKDCCEFAKKLSQDHTTFYYLPELKAGTVLDVFKRTDALRRPERFIELLRATQADIWGRGGDFSNALTPWFDQWQRLLKTVQKLDISEIVSRFTSEPHKIPEALHQKRCETIAPLLQTWQNA